MKPRKRKTVEAPQENTTRAKKPIRITGGRCDLKTGKKDDSSTRDDPLVLPFTVVHQLLKESRDSKKKQEIVPNAGVPLGKMKLQLFPIDERTRVGLEKDGHNPYLELTLRARKKISSVLKHLNTKWGSSSVAIGDVMLFQYNIQLENLATCKRWSINDDHNCAGDVYADIGSPSPFRLRYGWFSKVDSRFIKVPSKTFNESKCLQKSSGRIPFMDRNRHLQGACEVFKPNDTSKTANVGVVATLPVNVAVGGVEDEDEKKSFTYTGLLWENSLSNVSIGGMLSGVSLFNEVNNGHSKSKGIKSNSQPIQLLSSEISIGGLLSETSMQGKFVDNEAKLNGTKPDLQISRDYNGVVSSPVFWDDSFTTLSIGGLLSEVSLQAKIDRENKPPELISDSLGAFNFEGLKSQAQPTKPSTQVLQSSFLDAEETCHAFSFGKSSLAGKTNALLGSSATPTNRNSISELNTQCEFVQDQSRQDSKTGLLAQPRIYNNENSIGLGGITWTESLGPFGISFPVKQQSKAEDNVSVSEFVR